MGTTASTRRREATQKRLEAIRNPLRAQILELLVMGPNSPSKMAKALDASTQLVSQHVKRLVELECAELAEKVEVRGAVEHYYRATDRVLVEGEDWESLPAEVREHQVWQYATSIVNDLELGLKRGTVGPDRHFHLTQTRLVLDEEGREKVLEIQELARLAIERVQVESSERLARSGREGVNWSSLIGGFAIPAEP